MPLRETEAIVLRTYRLGEADKIVSLFTRQWGRLRAVAAGALRPKNRFGSTLEPLTYIRVWLFERENRDLLRMNSTELLESFFDMQKEFKTQLAGQYVAEVCERFFLERDVNERGFRLILVVLRAMRREAEIELPLLYFDYWVLRLAGFLPELDRCQQCGKALGEGKGYFGPAPEGLLCSACRRSLDSRTVAAEARRFTETAQTLSLDRWGENTAAPASCREARLFLEAVIETRAEKKLLTRELLNQQI